MHESPGLLARALAFVTAGGPGLSRPLDPHPHPTPDHPSPPTVTAVSFKPPLQ